MAFSNPGNPPISSGDRTASAHKAWLEKVAAAMELMQWFMAQDMGGGGTGWWAYGSVGYDSAKPAVTGLDTTVTVGVGAGFYGGVPFRNAAESSVEIPAPVSDGRIDLVAWDAKSSLLKRIAGTEASTPAAPALPTDHVEVCRVRCRVGQTVILSSDTDAGEGYITDTRSFVN